MKVFKIGFLFIFFLSTQAFSQEIDDQLLWTWTRIQGDIDSPFLPDSLDGKLVGSVEFQYRLDENFSDFQSLILRPMVGYKLDNGSTLWMGYAYIENESENGNIREQRLFQMISYSHTFKKLPIVFVGNTRVEERFFENSNDIAIRLRQMLRVSINLFKIKENQVYAFIQNEYFHNLNSTDIISAPSFDQNRSLIGLGYRTNIRNTPVDFNVGYMRNFNSSGQLFHGVNIGVSITIPSKKNNRRSRKQD